MDTTGTSICRMVSYRELVTLIHQSTCTAKRLASLIASKIDTLQNTINGYEIAWNSTYNVHVCMIQTNADFIFRKLTVFVSCLL